MIDRRIPEISEKPEVPTSVEIQDDIRGLCELRFLRFLRRAISAANFWPMEIPHERR
jgi:hypothetical protein